MSDVIEDAKNALAPGGEVDQAVAAQKKLSADWTKVSSTHQNGVTEAIDTAVKALSSPIVQEALAFIPEPERGIIQLAIEAVKDAETAWYAAWP